MKKYKPEKYLGLTGIIVFALTFFFSIIIVFVYITTTGYLSDRNISNHFDIRYVIPAVTTPSAHRTIGLFLSGFLGLFSIGITIIMIAYAWYNNRTYAEFIGFEGTLSNDILTLQKKEKTKTISLDRLNEFGFFSIDRWGVFGSAVYFKYDNKETFFFTPQYMDLLKEIKEYLKPNFNLEEKKIGPFVKINHRISTKVLPKREDKK